MTDSPLQTQVFPRLRRFVRAHPSAGTGPEPSGGTRTQPAGGTGAEPSAETAEAPAVCELCSVPLMHEHRHMLEMESRKVVCACHACGLLFHDVVDGRFKLIPRDARVLEDFVLSDVQWESLAVPIDLVFVVRDSVLEKRMALYPSPAGVTESQLPLDAWEDIAAANPSLDLLEDDVEALLINRLNAEARYFAAPIDKCYELAGLIRVHWRGFSGGDEVWEQVEQFFNGLSRHA